MSTNASCAKTNVSRVERTASIFGGGALMLAGLSQRSFKGLLLSAIGGAVIYRGVSGHCQVYQALGINSPIATEAGVHQGVQIEGSVLVSRPRAELFQFWKRLENLPLIMSHLISVEKLDSKHSRWIAKGPLNQKVSWNSEIINEIPNQLLAWQSSPGSEIQSAGSVRFDEAENGDTRVSVKLQYLPPAGKLGAIVAKLLGDDPSIQLNEDLKQFKDAMEAVESTAESAVTTY